MARPLSPRHRFGMLFVGVARRWRNAVDMRLGSLGLTDATWTPLIHIQRAGEGICQKDLASRIGLDGSSLVRLLDILVAKGFIERRQDAADRRSNLLFMTQAGQAATRDIQRALTQIDAEMLADFDETELEALTTALERIDARIKAVGPERVARE